MEVVDAEEQEVVVVVMVTNETYHHLRVSLDPHDMGSVADNDGY